MEMSTNGYCCTTRLCSSSAVMWPLVSWIRESNVPELFFLKWADPDRALAALDVIEAAQRNVGLPAVGTFADLLDAGDDAIETLRAALERWDALP